MSDWLKQLLPALCEAIKQHPVLALVLAFVVALWSVALPTEAISSGWVVGLTVALVLVGLLFDTFMQRAEPVRDSVPNIVLFDESHGQPEWIYAPAPTIERGYGQIAETTRRHYNAEILKKGEDISLKKLRNYAALVLPIGPAGKCSLTPNERKAITEYVRQGGGLLLLSIYAADWHHKANLNEIAQNYGMVFDRDVVMPKGATAQDARDQFAEGTPGSKNVVSAAPTQSEGEEGIVGELIKDVHRVTTISSCSLTISDAAVPIVTTDPESVVFEPEPIGGGIAIRRYLEKQTGPVPIVGASRSGKVIAVGSWKMFLDEFVDLPNSDNGRLYQNILGWLTTRR